MKNLSTWRVLLVAAAILATVCTGVLAQDKKSPEMHSIVTPAELKWIPIISGRQIAVVYGDPDKDGEPYTVRFHGEDGAHVPPHWHPGDENITVLQGAVLVGVGEKYDEQQLKTIMVGSYM